MSTTASGLILGFILATLYGAGFHLIIGGKPRLIVVYLLASWLGFFFGHFVGNFFGIDTFKLGAVYLLTASLGSWLFLVVSWILTGRDQ